MDSTENLESVREDITNQALRLLLRRLGDAALVKVEPEKSGGNGWLVTVYGRGPEYGRGFEISEIPVGELHYSSRGELLSDEDIAIRQMWEKVGELISLSNQENC